MKKFSFEKNKNIKKFKYNIDSSKNKENRHLFKKKINNISSYKIHIKVFFLIKHDPQTISTHSGLLPSAFTHHDENFCWGLQHVSSSEDGGPSKNLGK